VKFVFGSIVLLIQKPMLARHWWLAPVILPLWEAEIERTEAEGQPEQTVHETPISKKNNQSKMDQRCRSSSRAKPQALAKPQVQTPVLPKQKTKNQKPMFSQEETL
jgi:hypothetical protein